MANFKNSSDSIFGRIMTSLLICLVASILVSFILILMPEKSENSVICIIAGCAFIINGLCNIYINMKREGAKIFNLNMLLGIAMCAIGALIIVLPSKEIKLPVICLGLYLISNGVLKCNYGYWLKIGSENGWKVTFVSGVFLIILGIVLMLFKFSTPLNIILGPFILISSIVDVNNVLMFNNNKESIMSIFW